MLAEVCAADDQCEEGLKSVADAQLHADRMGERWWQAEIHRVRGVLLLMRSGDVHAEVEHCFRQALDVARGQAAKSLELRAAASLARLWRDQGKADDARSLLAPIYGWFTEGFDTADLKCAKALLDELGLGRPRAGEVCAELRSGRRRQSSGATVRSRNGTDGRCECHAEPNAGKGANRPLAHLAARVGWRCRRSCCSAGSWPRPWAGCGRSRSRRRAGWPQPWSSLRCRASPQGQRIGVHVGMTLWRVVQGCVLAIAAAIPPEIRSAR